MPNILTAMQNKPTDSLLNVNRDKICPGLFCWGGQCLQFRLLWHTSQKINKTSEDIVRSLVSSNLPTSANMSHLAHSHDPFYFTTVATLMSASRTARRRRVVNSSVVMRRRVWVTHEKGPRYIYNSDKSSVGRVKLLRSTQFTNDGCQLNISIFTKCSRDRQI